MVPSDLEMKLQEEEGCSDDAPHVLVIPFPDSGHIIPLINLCRHLIANTRLFITVLLVTPDNLIHLQPLLSAYPSSVQTLLLPLPPPPLLDSSHLHSAAPARHIIFRFGLLHKPLLKWFSDHPSPPSAIISDIFLGWTHRLALDLRINRIVFSPSAAISLCVISSLWRQFPKQGLNGSVAFPNIPNSPQYPWSQISGMFRAHVEGDPVSEFIKQGFLSNMTSHGIVVNTFHDLETPYINHLRKELGHDRVWAVGPLLPPRFDSSLSEKEAIISWLDLQENNSVVYVCFGSLAKLNTAQMDQLGLGLEKSGVHFIWVVGQDSQVPQGFQDRVAGRGMVIRGWAPQIPILSHRAVGSFLTHCGWNSVVEGIVAGVQMLAWPMNADQFVDATLIVDELRVAIRVCEGANAVPDPDELARVVAESVDKNSTERSKQAMNLRTSALESIQQGGSSTKELLKFIKHLKALAS